MDVSLDLTFTQAEVETIVTTYTLPDAVAGAVPQGHWTDVDLARQTVTLMDGETPIQTFTMSSGSADHPTPTGTYAVYQRVPSQTVAGCVDSECYSYPDVRWCTWFFGDFGFHTAYWHEDFGKPVSHGCLNLREEDAKKVYDWLLVGDKVVIH
jgi:lipoprotein-anchoring transpeptidase ErfK/SrfK